MVHTTLPGENGIPFISLCFPFYTIQPHPLFFCPLPSTCQTHPTYHNVKDVEHGCETGIKSHWVSLETLQSQSNADSIVTLVLDTSGSFPDQWHRLHPFLDALLPKSRLFNKLKCLIIILIIRLSISYKVSIFLPWWYSLKHYTNKDSAN